MSLNLNRQISHKYKRSYSRPPFRPAQSIHYNSIFEQNNYLQSQSQTNSRTSTNSPIPTSKSIHRLSPIKKPINFQCRSCDLREPIPHASPSTEQKQTKIRQKNIRESLGKIINSSKSPGEATKPSKFCSSAINWFNSRKISNTREFYPYDNYSGNYFSNQDYQKKTESLDILQKLNPLLEPKRKYTQVKKKNPFKCHVIGRGLAQSASLNLLPPPNIFNRNPLTNERLRNHLFSIGGLNLLSNSESPSPRKKSIESTTKTVSNKKKSITQESSPDSANVSPSRLKNKLRKNGFLNYRQRHEETESKVADLKNKKLLQESKTKMYELIHKTKELIVVPTYNVPNNNIKEIKNSPNKIYNNRKSQNMNSLDASSFEEEVTKNSPTTSIRIKTRKELMLEKRENIFQEGFAWQLKLPSPKIMHRVDRRRDNEQLLINEKNDSKLDGWERKSLDSSLDSKSYLENNKVQ